ncbi:hypothetical protein ACN20G_11790 [Streptomyces sp. BI20]|uniref:hypothetical protein n=1 Tax=Streptomyces sp. BI20 TaxID=3403460 RepID=UPI003C711820
MDGLISSGLQTVLYVVVAVVGLAMVAVAVSTARGRRDAGFAPRAVVRRELSVRALGRAKEIRPSLHTDEKDPVDATTPVSLNKAVDARREV